MSKTRYEWTLLDYAIWYAGARHRARSTRRRPPTSSPGSSPTPAPALRRRRDRRARRRLVARRRRDGARARAACGSSTRRRRGGPGRRWPTLGRRAVADADARGAPRGGRPRRRGHDHLHLGHHRAAQGVRAHARATSSSSSRRPPTSSRRSSTPTTPSTLLFLPLAHVFARIIQVGAVRKRVRLGPHRRRPAPARGPRDVPRRRSCSACRASSRRSSTPRASGPRRRPRAALRPRDRRGDRLQPGARPRPARAGAARPARALRPAGLRAGCGPRSAGAAATRSPAAPRSASGWRTSSGASGSRSSRATASPRRPAAVTVNPPDATADRHRRAARCPGAAVRVDDEGELLVARRPGHAGVLAGRRRRPPRCSADDGWLRTGDLGEIDDEGFVRVTGRRKEILVTAGGKNVAPGAPRGPGPRPPAGRASAWSWATAAPTSPRWSPSTRTPSATWARPAREAGRRWPTSPTTPTCVAEVPARPSTTPTRTVSQAESIRRFAILPGDWTEESGELTPSLKLRRNVVMREFRREIEALYD